jgi:hypothetical protein
MALITAKTLVLRGVSVEFGGKADLVRLGSGYRGQKQVPSIPFIVRHLSEGCAFWGHEKFQDLEPRMRPDSGVNRAAVSAANGAGRPRSLRGVFHCRSAVSNPGQTSTCWKLAKHKSTISWPLPGAKSSIEAALTPGAPPCPMHTASTQGGGPR